MGKKSNEIEANKIEFGILEDKGYEKYATFESFHINYPKTQQVNWDTDRYAVSHIDLEKGEIVMKRKDVDSDNEE